MPRSQQQSVCWGGSKSRTRQHVYFMSQRNTAMPSSQIIDLGAGHLELKVPGNSPPDGRNLGKHMNSLCKKTVHLTSWHFKRDLDTYSGARLSSYTASVSPYTPLHIPTSWTSTIHQTPGRSVSDGLTHSGLPYYQTAQCKSWAHYSQPCSQNTRFIMCGTHL